MARKMHHSVPPVNFSEIGARANKALDEITRELKKPQHNISLQFDGTDPHPTAVSCDDCEWEAAVG